LPLRELRHYSPDCVHLFFSQYGRLGRDLVVREPVAKIRSAQPRAQCAPPKFQATVAFMLAHEINCDLHKPGRSAGIAAELVTGSVGTKKAVLGQVFGRFTVPERS